MIRILRQIIRGCGTLPHVGDHPGTMFAVVLPAAGGAAGGWGGAAIMAVIVLPPYLYGAYDRAEYSDQIERGDESDL